jgi:hypothetical protein
MRFWPYYSTGVKTIKPSMVGWMCALESSMLVTQFSPEQEEATSDARS